MRLVVLDQIGFQRQRFRFAVGDDELDLAHLPHHQRDARGMGMPPTALEVAAHAVAQHLGLADVEDAVLAIAQQIAAGLSRHLPQTGLQAAGILQEGCGGAGQGPQPPYCQPVLLSSSAAPSRCRVALFTSPTNTV